MNLARFGSRIIADQHHDRADLFTQQGDRRSAARALRSAAAEEPDAAVRRQIVEYAAGLEQAADTDEGKDLLEDKS